MSQTPRIVHAGFQKVYDVNNINDLEEDLNYWINDIVVQKNISQSFEDGKIEILVRVAIGESLG